MRNIIAASLISAILAFLAGYFFAFQKSEAVAAQHELAALMHYTPALSYLQNGQIENAKNILYIGTDGSLSVLSKNSDLLSEADSKALNVTLGHLNQSWDIDKPFDSEKSHDLKTVPGWLEMREKNDAFRYGYSK